MMQASWTLGFLAIYPAEWNCLNSVSVDITITTAFMLAQADLEQGEVRERPSRHGIEALAHVQFPVK